MSTTPLFARLETGSWELAHRLAEGALAQRGIEARRVTTAYGSLRVFEIAGRSTAPPLVLLHGLGASALGVLSLALSLDGARPCVAVDLFDFAGDSRRSFSPFGMRPLRVAEHAASIAQMLEQRGIATYDLYGVSLGAWIALHVAASSRAPRKALLVSPLGLAADIAELRVLARRADQEGIDAVADRFTKEPPAERLPLARGIARLLLRAGAAVGRTKEFASALDDSDAVDDLLPRITTEVAVLAPEQDRLVGSASAQTIFERIPHASGAWALGASHNLPIEAPGLITLALRELVGCEELASEAPGRWARARLHLGTLPQLRPMVRS